MNWEAFLSTFGLVFLAELGDKTQLAVVAQTCKYRSHWPVFLGGSLALTAVTALGVAGGRLLSGLIPAIGIRAIGGLGFLVMAVLVWWNRGAMAEGAADAVAYECADEGGPARLRRERNWRAFSSTFVLLFLAELGDKTQLTIIGLASKQSGRLLGTFAGGTLALTAVTALGVLGGQQLIRLIPEPILLKLSAVAFAVMGVLMVLGVL